MASPSKPPASQHVYHEGFPLKDGDRISLFHRLTRTRVGIALFLFYIVSLTLPIVPLAILGSFLILRLDLVRHMYMRRFFDFGIGSWLFLMAHSMEMFLGIKSRMFGHLFEFDKRCVIIMNHRCHFDWLFFFSVVAKQGQLTYWTVIQKYASKYVPLLGWCMQFRNHLFLSRQWEKDAEEFSWKLSYINHTDSPYQLLLFPEGTDLTPEHKTKYDKFAEASGWPLYDYCLHPKSTGFIHTLNLLKKHKIDSVYDITVGYPDIFAKTEYNLVIEGRVPREIHYHIVRYNISDIPTTNEDLEQWLRDRWREKEERLRQFYMHREFRVMEFDKKSKHHQDNSNGVTLYEFPQRIKWIELLRAVCIVGLFFFTSVLLAYIFPVLYVFLWVVGTGVCVYYTFYTDGLDYYVMKCYKRDFDFMSEKDKQS